jgi:N-acetylglucosamine-6-phosphate deacetylase
MIFKNARLIFPDGIRDQLEVIESGGKICGIREAGRYPDDDGLDLAGNYLAPGFIDLHVHGAMRRDAMEASAEAFREICAFHASGGTTALLLTTATAPIAQILDVLRAVKGCAAQLPQITGVHLEGPFISRARAGAQRSEFICNPDAQTIERLLEFSDLIKRLTIAPELPGALAAMDQLRERGIAMSGGHSDAWDEEAGAAFDHGMRHVTHTFNCMSSARRRGLERVAGLLEFALSEPEIICELIADGHHVSPTLMKMLYRAKGSGGICLVTDATAGAGLPDGSRFELAGIDCVAADGACYLADGSALAGSAARMIDLVRNMVTQAGIALPEAVVMATANPAKAAGLKTKGALEVGADADFVVLSPELEMLEAYVAGDRIYPTDQR